MTANAWCEGAPSNKIHVLSLAFAASPTGVGVWVVQLCRLSEMSHFATPIVFLRKVGSG